MSCGGSDARGPENNLLYFDTRVLGTNVTKMGILKSTRHLVTPHTSGMWAAWLRLYLGPTVVTIMHFLQSYTYLEYIV